MSRISVIASTLIAALLIVNAPEAKAASSSDETDEDDPYFTYVQKTNHRFQLCIYNESAYFKKNNLSLTGTGLGATFQNAFTDHLTVGLGLGQTFALSSTIGILYTVIRTEAAYALWGQFSQQDTEVLVQGQTVVSTQTQTVSSVAVTAGLEEYLFNGSTTITPATGLTLGFQGKFPVFGVLGLAAIRSGALSLNGSTSIPVVINLGVSFSF